MQNDASVTAELHIEAEEIYLHELSKIKPTGKRSQDALHCALMHSRLLLGHLKQLKRALVEEALR